MKKLALIAALGLSSLALSSHAATATGNFDVTINLTSACIVGTPAAAAFTYTSFQAGPAPATTTNITVKCTNSLAYTVKLDDGAGGLAAAATQTYTDAATNLQYSLTVGTVAAGTGADQTIALTGTMAGGQSGTCIGTTCSNSTSTNKQRTLTLTY